TAHAVLANQFLSLLNSACGTAFKPVDLEAIAAADPVTEYRVAPGRQLTTDDLSRPLAVVPADVPPTAPPARSEPRPTVSLPTSLEAALELNYESSYFGDALRVAHTTCETDICYGSSPNTFFGGLCLTQSHVRGHLHVKFSQPDGDTARVELSFGDGLVGDDGVIAAPQFLKLPSIGNVVTDIDDFRSHGDLNLATGEVTNLTVKAAFANSALTALASVNPKARPVRFEFSTEAQRVEEFAATPHCSSAFAKSEQRADGTLDFAFNGVSFVPLSSEFGRDSLRFPLPFSGPEMKFASVPAASTVLHPHICLSTRPPERTPV